MEDETSIKVSVICIAYNHEKYIGQALNSFVSQKTNFNYEVLVHDDASTDKTADIIRQYEMKYSHIIKPIYQATNQYSKGKRISCDILYPKCSGEYLAFCEGDDYWCDEYKLQKQLDAMENHPECCMCVCRTQCIDEKGNKLERVIPQSMRVTSEGVYSSYTIAEVLWEENIMFHTSSRLIRRCVMSDIVNDTIYTKYMPGDAAMYRSALRCGDFYYVNEIMSCYRNSSVGSWTYRYLKLSDEEKREHEMKMIKGDLIYDEYTDRKFHKLIMQYVANYIYSCRQRNDTSMRKMLGEFNIKEKEVMKNCSIKKRVLYYIAKIYAKFYR